MYIYICIYVLLISHNSISLVATPSHPGPNIVPCPADMTAVASN